MAYVNKETKATIVNAAKPVLKKYGIKATFAVDNYSTIVVNIKSGALDFIGNYNQRQIKEGYGEPHIAKTYLDVNPYHYQTQFTGIVKEFLIELMAAAKSAGWYNNSDSMTDYFDVAYYIDINVGKWDKPYLLDVPA